MSAMEARFDGIVAGIEKDPECGAVLHRVVQDYPDELAMKILTTAMRRGVITASEAFSVVRASDLDLRQTVEAVAKLAARRGWLTEEVVLEALGAHVDVR
jgi:hypothetical protein